MAISLKGMRKITVSGEVFLWKIRKKMSHDENHNDQVMIPVQHNSGGQVLFVFVGFTRAYGGYINNSPKSVTPKMIEPLILEAILLGWKYFESGNAIALVNGKLEKDTRTAKWKKLKPDVMSAAAFFEEYGKGRRVFCNQQLDEPEAFRNADLSGCLFMHCEMNALFEGTDLTETEFYGCDLKRSKFIRCDLTNGGIRLSTIDLIEFSEVNISGCTIEYNWYYEKYIQREDFQRIFLT
ncbi:MAG: pentapeptide repeat-containing protein [Fluviicola sp.]